MGTLDNQMARRVNMGCLLLGIATPEEEGCWGAGCHVGDHGIGDDFPSATCMAAGHAGADAERSIQEEHAAIRPGLEAAVPGRRDPEIVLKFLKDVA